MQEFLEFVLRQLIDFPDEMILTRVEAPKKTIFRLRLRQSDIGKVVGKHGATIASIRTLLNAAASRHNEKALLEIIEDHAPHPHESSMLARPTDAGVSQEGATMT